MSIFRTLDSVDVSGKRVLLRVDLNVPTDDGRVTDLTRIERQAPTITEIADKGGKVILLSHFGRPKGRDPKQSLRPVAAAVAQVIKRPVAFAEDCVGAPAETAVAAMKPGDILCLENTRFHAGEEKNDPAFVAELAKFGDLWVNDAFSAAHRAHASTEGLGHQLPGYAGRGMQAELDALGKALEAPQRPVTAIVGGAKVSTKLDLLQNLAEKVDMLVVGGGMANTFLLAQGVAVGKSLTEPDLKETAKQIFEKPAGAYFPAIYDVVVAPALARGVPVQTVSITSVPADQMILDFGPMTVAEIKKCIRDSATVVWNGPLGAFEIPPFNDATNEIAQYVAELTEAGRLISVAGGGDTVAALNAAGVADKFTYVSTAGGAFLEWMEGKSLPGVEVLRVR